MSNGSTTAANIKQEEESSKMQFEVNLNGCMTNCNFYIPDATTNDNTALAFRVAYHFAKNSKNNKEISACVASMLCSVVPGFKNSVVEALKSIGVTPCFVSLPSQAHENNIVASEISLLDCPSILVKVRCDPSNKLDIPFDSTKAYAICTMLGSPDLCETVKKFLKNSGNHPSSQIRNMCEYLIKFLRL